MSQPVIFTPRLELVPLNESPEHRQFLLELDTDPEVMRYIAFGRPFDEKEVELCREALLKTAEPTGFGTWVAQLRNNRGSNTTNNNNSPTELVGWWVLSPSETNPDKRAEFGLRVAREFWGQGFAKEGTLALLRYAFESMPNLGTVYGETMTVNEGSCKTMASCGMRFVRKYFNEYKDFTPAPGIEEGEVEYAITREEWEEAQIRAAVHEQQATRARQEAKLQAKQFDSGKHRRIPMYTSMPAVAVGSFSA